MKKRILLGLALLVLLFLILLAFVVIPVRNDLLAARRILRGPVEKLNDERVEEAKAHVESALGKLDSFPAKVLGLVPFVGGNLDAVERVSERVPPALDAGLVLKTEAEALESGGVLDRGRVKIEALASLHGPLEDQVETLTALEDELAAHTTGSLWPSLWEAFYEFRYEISEIRQDAEDFSGLLAEIDSLLGQEGKRTYLILLMNNSELRGAGGVLTGVGTMTADHGELKLGAFTSVHRLRADRAVNVDVPPDFERFTKYEANSTSLWLNTTYSPDVPDVALVASRMYEEVTGTKTDGVMAVDPRGIAALMPQDATLEVQGDDIDVSTRDLADFIYSDAYEEFNDQQERRDAILELGARAFKLILEADLDDRDDIQRVADAFSGGHLRVVSFEESEQEALSAVGVSGDLEPAPGDSVLVTAQNEGGAQGIGSKMNYWTERDIVHECAMRSDAMQMSCLTRVELTNEAPNGLPGYVTGKTDPYAVLRDFVEIYVPAAAEVTSVERDDKPIADIVEEQADRTSRGVVVQVPPDESSSIEVGYDLPIDGAYSVVATPQPLTSDAHIELALRVPADWNLRGPGRWEDGIFRYDGSFDQTLSISASPVDRSGLPALWDSLTDFWREPLF